MAIYYDSMGYFTENVFMNNVATAGGGGVDVYDNSAANFSNNTLVNNTAVLNGGAVYGEFTSLVEFNGNKFIENSAMDGGGVAIKYNSRGNFTGNNFVNNSNTWEIEIDTTSTATFVNNNFTDYAIYGSTINTASIYYVKPSPDTLCPESPCHTLSEYLGMADQYFTLNTTLVLLPGDHILEEKLLVRDISALTLIGGTTDGNSSRSLSASVTRINCTSMRAFFNFQGISILNISAVSFVSCGNTNSPAMSLLELLHGSISNCVFQKALGGHFLLDRLIL